MPSGPLAPTNNPSVLEQKLAEAKSKKDTLKARAASAKTSKQVQEMIGSLNTSNAVVAFDKMEEKVNGACVGVYVCIEGGGLGCAACRQLGVQRAAQGNQPCPLAHRGPIATQAVVQLVGQVVAGDGLDPPPPSPHHCAHP